MDTQQSVSFDRAAGFYDETRGFPDGVAGQVGQLIAHTGNLTPSSRILEVGIGTGRIALPLAEHVGAIFGVDIASAMLDVLRAKQTDERVYVTQADATQLPFDANSFDAVVGVHIVHPIPQLQKALHEVRRVLKPDGLLLHGYSGNDTLAGIRRNAFSDADPFVSGVRWSEIDSFLMTAGWQKSDEGRFDFSYELPPIIIYEQMQQRIWSRTWFMDDAEHARLLAKLHNLLHAQFPDPHQPIMLTNHFTIEGYRPA